MLKDELHISTLISGHFKGELQVQQQQELDNWLKESEANRLFFAQFSNVRQINQDIADYRALDTQGLWERTARKIAEAGDQSHHLPVRQLSRIYRYIAAAASLLLIAGLAWYFYAGTSQSESALQYANDLKPGRTSATLTLQNGKQILLSQALNGKLAQQAGVSIRKTSKGQLVYDLQGSSTGGGDSPGINTLTTAKGETYQVILPDGSLVVLNAASSLRYQAGVVSQGKRMVELRGEAYFEITKDSRHPFVVKTESQQVEVLGTHFNVSAYDDEPEIKTTLLEGSVKVNSGNEQALLHPGEQTVRSVKGRLRVQQADLEEAVAWKDGQFVFATEEIGSIMKKIARWYDVDIDYQGGDIAHKTIWGSVSRYKNASEVLDMLSATKTVKFKIEGRKIIVMSYGH